MQNQEQAKPRIGLNGFTLKMIAMITMAIDHTGMVLFPQYMIFRIIGRLAFPIYCFLLVEGAVHTTNRKKYLGRMLLFALISEVPFDLVCTGYPFSLYSQNVFFTLFLGLAAIFLLERTRRNVYGMLGVIAIILLAEFAYTDYGSGGIVIIMLFYLFREQKLFKSVGFAAADIFLYGGITSVQSYGVFSLIPILCYNGRRGPSVKYLFYVFYPVHLLVLYWLRRMI